MSDPGSVSRGARPLKLGERITARHLGGQTHAVEFDTIAGDKLNLVRVRWPAAGFYDVDLKDGSLLGVGGGKKGRRGAAVWSIVPEDMARIRATQEQMKVERKERMRLHKRATA
jgi:hypothetical protein